MLERIHKILAHAGFGSRRGCEVMIDEGRVMVNGRRAQIGDKVELGVDDIRIDGRRVQPERKVYYLLNKPPGFISTSSDPEGRRKVNDLLPGVRERVYPVGRLDADSRGLVLMTNDGDLAARLTHPRYEVPKTYEAEVKGSVTPEELQKLISGVWLSEGPTARANAKLLRRGASQSLLLITLREGRNREVRRMLARLGHPVRKLTRVRIGPLTLRGIGPGKFRPLTADEIKVLYRTGEAAAKRSEGGAEAEEPVDVELTAAGAETEELTATERPAGRRTGAAGRQGTARQGSGGRQGLGGRHGSAARQGSGERQGSGGRPGSAGRPASAAGRSGQRSAAKPGARGAATSRDGEAVRGGAKSRVRVTGRSGLKSLDSAAGRGGPKSRVGAKGRGGEKSFGKSFSKGGRKSFSKSGKTAPKATKGGQHRGVARDKNKGKPKGRRLYDFTA